MDSYTHVQDFQRVVYKTTGMGALEFQRNEWEKKAGEHTPLDNDVFAFGLMYEPYKFTMIWGLFCLFLLFSCVWLVLVFFPPKQDIMFFVLFS